MNVCCICRNACAPYRQAPCCLIHIHLLCCAVAFPLVIPSICIVSQNLSPTSFPLRLPQSSSKLAYPLLYYISFSFGQLTTFLRLLCECGYLCMCIDLKYLPSFTLFSPIHFLYSSVLVARVLWFFRSLTRHAKKKYINTRRPKN